MAGKIRGDMTPTQRLLVLVGAIVFVDTMFFAAITPLLPYYAEELGLAKGSAGLLAAAYPAGALVGSLPGGWLAARAGVKPALLLGLFLLAVSSVAFGAGDDLVTLLVARFVQGLGGAASWAAGLAWLVAAGPPGRRAELIGRAFSAAIAGALLGPVLGAGARAAGPGVVFSGVAVAACGLALWAARERAPERVAAPAAVGLRRDAGLYGGLAAIVLVGLFFGAVEVLVPLRLDGLGAGGTVIGGAFLAAAALQALASPAVGRFADRHGPLTPIRVSLLAATVTAILLPLPAAVWLLVVLVVLAGPVVGSLWVPGMAMVSEAAERSRLDQAHAFALVNLVWAGAQMVGAAAGGRTAQGAGDAVAFAALAVVLGMSLAVSLSRRATASPAGGAPT